MVDLYLVTFGILTLLYVAYSAWHRMDPRYPIAGALGLLALAGLADAAGSELFAETVAAYVFLLLGAGILLYLIEYARESRVRSSGGASGDAPAERPERPDER